MTGGLTIQKLLDAKAVLDTKVAEPLYFPNIKGEWKIWEDLTPQEKEDIFEANRQRLKELFGL